MPNNDEPNTTKKTPAELTAEAIADIGRSSNMSEGAIRSLIGTVTRSQQYEMNAKSITQIEKDPSYKIFRAGPSHPEYDELLQSPLTMERVHRLHERRQRKLEVNATMSERMAERARSSLEGDIQRRYSSSSINGDVMGMMGSSDIQAESMRIMQQGPAKVSKTIRELYSSIEADKSRAIREVHSGVIDRDTLEASVAGVSGVASITGSMDANISALARYKQANRFLKAEGKDVESQHITAIKEATTAENLLRRSAIQEKYARGEGESLEELEKKQVEVAKKLIAVREKLATASEEVAEQLFKEREDLTRQRKTIEESMRIAGGGGTGGGGGGGGGGLSLSGGFAALSASYAAEVARRNNLEQIKGGYADIENYKYDTFGRAMRGDMKALLAMQSFTDAGKFAREQMTEANDSAFYGMMADVVAMGEGVKKGVKKGNPAKIVGSVSSGVSNLTTSVPRFFQGVDAQLQAQNSWYVYQQTQEAMKHMSGEQMSTTYGFLSGLTMAGRGMGGRARDAMLSSLTGRVGLIRMGQAGITAQDMISAQAFGAENLGNQFDTEQVYLSRRMERLGFGGLQQNLARMGAFANAGANNPQKSFETAMAQALSQSIENSKVLNAVAQNTASMASTGAAMGIDTTAAVSRQLLGAVTTTGNQTFEVNQALRFGQAMGQRVTDITPGLTAGVGLHRLDVALAKAGISNIYAPMIQQLSPDIIETLRGTITGGNANEINEQLNTLGLGFLADRMSKPGGLDAVRSIVDVAGKNQLANALGGQAGYLIDIQGMPGLNPLLDKLYEGKISPNQAESAMMGRNAGIPYATPLDPAEVDVLRQSYTASKFDPRLKDNRARQMAAFVTAKGGIGMKSLTEMLGEQQRTQKDGMGAQMEDVMSDAAVRNVSQMRAAIDQLATSSGTATEAVGKLAESFKVMAKMAPVIEKIRSEQEQGFFESAVNKLGDLMMNFGSKKR